MTAAEQRARDQDVEAVADELAAEEEFAEAFGDALLFGVVIFVLGASTPFVLLVLAWLGGR